MEQEPEEAEEAAEEAEAEPEPPAVEYDTKAEVRGQRWTQPPWELNVLYFRRTRPSDTT